MGNRNLGYVYEELKHNNEWFGVWADSGSIGRACVVSVTKISTKETIYREEATETARRMAAGLSDLAILQVALGEVTADEAFAEHARLQEEARTKPRGPYGW